MKFIKHSFTFLLFVFLTALTQVGGIVYLLSRLSYRWIDPHAKQRWQRTLFHFLSFFILYTLATFVLVPILAKPFGRVPLSMQEQQHLKPLNPLTIWLNRNYVKPQLRQLSYEVAEEMHAAYPGTITHYLDGNFPFITGFPLLPHLSHNDGQKLDLAFFYLNASDSMPSNECPSFMGYGVCEGPMANEQNTCRQCNEKGFWQYGFLEWVVPQGKKKDFIFDAGRTKSLVEGFAANDQIGKIFIEPHLKARLGLSSGKVRFQGCRAVRHDDHIHVQLK